MADRPLTDQPTATPTRKVGAGGGAGLGVVLLLAVLAGVGIEVPGVAAAELPVGEAITGLAAFAAAYFTREAER